jgi:hypothetical protein
MLLFLTFINLIIISTFLYGKRNSINDAIITARDEIHSKIQYYFGVSVLISKDNLSKVKWSYASLLNFSQTMYATTTMLCSTNSPFHSSISINPGGSFQNSNGVIFSDKNGQISISEIISIKHDLIKLKQDFIETKFKHSFKIDNLEKKED